MKLKNHAANDNKSHILINKKLYLILNTYLIYLYLNALISNRIRHVLFRIDWDMFLLGFHVENK